MDDSKYAEIVHTRLSHVQVLVSILSGVMLTVTAGALGWYVSLKCSSQLVKVVDVAHTSGSEEYESTRTSDASAPGTSELNSPTHGNCATINVRLENKKEIKCAAIGLWFLLVWGHAFSLYNVFVVRKAAQVLTKLERNITIGGGPTEYNGPRYFEYSGKRIWLYFVSHGLLTVLPFVYTIGACSIGLMSWAWFAALAILTLLLYRFLRLVFG
jgi:hypothetical protein